MTLAPAAFSPPTKETRELEPTTERGKRPSRSRCYTAPHMTDTNTRCLSGHLVQVAQAGSRVVLHRIICTVTNGPDAGASADVSNPRLCIGIGESADLRLKDDSVSRHHCEILVRDGRYVLRDLDSTNGTAVNGVWIKEAFIEPGARLRIGETEVLFEGHASWLPVPPSPSPGFGELVGDHETMRAIFGIFEKVAPTSLSVLLTGETGTGKDVAARAIHEASGRGGPFVVVDCGGLSRNLVEAHLFGHERGAFTGAEKRRRGAFERANGGTVFLDEIGELALDLQPKLLRVLERREVEPLGAEEPRAVDVRVLAATHRDLSEMVESGAFREDLFFRLAEIVVEQPPLADRRDDIPGIALRLLHNAESAGVQEIAPDALAYLKARRWDGNVRELRNVIRRAAVLSPCPVLELKTLRSLESMSLKTKSAPKLEASGVDVHPELPIRDAREQWTRELEARYLATIVERFGDDIGQMAQHMNVHRKSVYRLLRQHGFID